MEKKDPLISFLIEEGILNEKTIDALLEQHQSTGQSLVSILKQENLLDENQLAEAVANANKIEFINLTILRQYCGTNHPKLFIGFVSKTVA